MVVVPARLRGPTIDTVRVRRRKDGSGWDATATTTTALLVLSLVSGEFGFGLSTRLRGFPLDAHGGPHRNNARIGPRNASSFPLGITLVQAITQARVHPCNAGRSNPRHFEEHFLLKVTNVPQQANASGHGEDQKEDLDRRCFFGQINVFGRTFPIAGIEVTKDDRVTVLVVGVLFQTGNHGAHRLFCVGLLLRLKKSG